MTLYVDNVIIGRSVFRISFPNPFYNLTKKNKFIVPKHHSDKKVIFVPFRLHNHWANFDILHLTFLDFWSKFDQRWDFMSEICEVICRNRVPKIDFI